MITVFYDGACGLCAKEIKYYQKIARAGFFTWIDITKEPDDFTRRGYDVLAGLKALHVQDEAGTMHKGVAAFVVIWRALPQPWPILAALCRLPFILPFLEAIYQRFAAWRFKKLGYDRCAL